MRLRHHTPLILLLLALLYPLTGFAGQKLVIGTTLHPYYSWVANIAGNTVELINVIPDNVDPHAYQMRPQDLENLARLQAIVVNTLGHDDYIEAMLSAAGKNEIPRIEPNRGLPLIPAIHNASALKVTDKTISYNSHSYVSILAAIQQINTISDELGKLIPENADLYRDNARQYAKTLRSLLRKTLSEIQDYKTGQLTIATVHDGYAYLFQELGITTDAVIQPRHGLEPSARQLADTIKRINQAKVNVLFTEIDYQKKYVDTIFQETGCRLYPLSHISNGPYSADKFVIDMQTNLQTIVTALTTDAK